MLVNIALRWDIHERSQARVFGVPTRDNNSPISVQ